MSKSFKKTAKRNKCFFVNGYKTPGLDINTMTADGLHLDAVASKKLVEPVNGKNIFHIIYYAGRAAGYSKIIYDTPFTESEIKNITKLERFYLLKDFYDMKLGLELFNFNIDLVKRNKQAGIWIYTWKENQKAIRFGDQCSVREGSTYHRY